MFKFLPKTCCKEGTYWHNTGYVSAGKNNQKREFGWTADENRAINKSHDNLRISYITYISKVILTGDTTCTSRKEE